MEGNTQSHPPHLEPSQLGTKEYWESFYENSLSHLSSKRGVKHHEHEDYREQNGEDENDAGSDDDVEDDYDDPGTSWFTEHNAPTKVLDFLSSPSFPLAPCNTSSSAPPSILDLGTGNGSMLALLRDEGDFSGGMVGVDYSPKSVELARQLHGQDSGITFEVWDILEAGVMDGRDLYWFPYDQGGFDIVLDKGTFDAVSLSADLIPETNASNNDAAAAATRESRVQRRVCERYPGIARSLVRKGGFLIVTSCNWTEAELVDWFTRDNKDADDGLVVWGTVEYPKFRFGGQEGQGVCTVCFKREGGSD